MRKLALRGFGVGFVVAYRLGVAGAYLRAIGTTYDGLLWRGERGAKRETLGGVPDQPTQVSGE